VSSGRWLDPDITKARALVRQSGTAGDRVTVVQDDEIAGRAAQTLLSALRSLGYRATFEREPKSLYYGPHIAQLAQGAEAGFQGWIADYVAASDFFVPLVECPAQPFNFPGRFCDPALDARISKALADESRQAGVAAQEWAAIDRAVANDALYVPITNTLEPDFVARRVGNFEYNPQWGVLVDQLWVR
jgi:peptide/nickel transport system substrate-binding protein